MVYAIENKMVVDAAWDWNTSKDACEETKGSGYLEPFSGIFVAEEDAWDYAMKTISLDENLKQEFVEWFYSNWSKED